MPGIVDMHAHPFTGVDMGTGGVSIDAMDPDTILETVRQFAAANPDRDVILGGNWSIGGLFENDSPDKKLLDEIVPDVPVFLLSPSGHSAWMNSKALELAGIDETVDNEGSYIFDRYPGTNEPSGTARDNGMVLVMNALHYLRPRGFRAFLRDGDRAVQQIWRHRHPARRGKHHLAAGSRLAGAGRPVGRPAVSGSRLVDVSAQSARR